MTVRCKRTACLFTPNRHPIWSTRGMGVLWYTSLFIVTEHAHYASENLFLPLQKCHTTLLVCICLGRLRCPWHPAIYRALLLCVPESVFCLFLQVEQVKLLDRFSPSNKSSSGTLYLTATHLLFIDAQQKEIWVGNCTLNTSLQKPYHMTFNVQAGSWEDNRQPGPGKGSSDNIECLVNCY